MKRSGIRESAAHRSGAGGGLSTICVNLKPRMIDLDPSQVPLAQIDVSQAELYENEAHWPLFAHLRRADTK